MSDLPILFSAPMVRALLAGTKTQTRRLLNPEPEHLQVYDWKGKRLHDSVYRHWCWNGHVGADNWASISDQLRPFLRHQIGDRLWVKETWCDVNLNGAPGLAYRADDHLRDLMLEPDFLSEDGSFDYEADRLKFGKDGNGLTWAVWAHDLIGGVEGKWRSPLHTPRWASRVTLTVSETRVERLNDITDADALAEGVVPRIPGSPRTDYWVPGIEHPNPDFPYLSRPTPREMYAALWDVIHGSGAWLRNPWVTATTFSMVPKNIGQLLAAEGYAYAPLGRSAR